MAYLVGGGTGFQVIDVSNPASPLVVGSCPIDGYATRVTVSGTHAYVGDAAGTLRILDVSDPIRPVVLGTYSPGGSVEGISVSGQLAYLALEDAGLQVIDVHNPAKPARLGTYRPFGGAFAVVVSGTVAYVADGEGLLQLIDVRNPTRPVLLAKCGTGYAEGVHVSGTLAYVAGPDALEVIDVSNAAEPVTMGKCPGAHWSGAVAVSGTLAYAAEWGVGFQIIDVSDPLHPALLNSYRSPTQAYYRALTVSGTVAYAAGGVAGLDIFDVAPLSAPLAPRLQAASDTGFSNRDNITSDNSPTFDLSLPPGMYFRLYSDGAQVSGDYESGEAYTTPPALDGAHLFSLVVLDAAGNASAMSPPSPVTIDSTIPSVPDLLPVSDTGVSDTDKITNLDNSGPGKALQFSVGNTVAGAEVTICADGVPIASALAVGATTIMRTDGNYDLADGPHTLTARQAVAGRPEWRESAGLYVTIDTTAPAAFASVARVGGCATAGSAQAVTVVGPLAFVVGVADRYSIFEAIDVSDPTHPQRRGEYDLYDTDVGLAVLGTTAYLSHPYYGLDILDVSNPAHPWRSGRFGRYTYWWYPHDVAVSGRFAYLANELGLEVLDVGDPAEPALAGTCRTFGRELKVTASGNQVYLVGEIDGLRIIDVSDPHQPLPAGQYGSDGSPQDVAVSGAVAYLTDASKGLQVLDVSDPASPFLLGECGTGGSAQGVAVSGTLVFVAAGSAGLQVFDVSDPRAPTRLAAYDTGGQTIDVAASGSLAYVVDAGTGLHVIDVTRFSSPPPPDLRSASDTGLSSTDNVTGESAPILDLFLPAGTYFRLYCDGVQVTGDYQNDASYVSPSLADGAYAFTVASVDTAGNVSPSSSALAVTIDSRIPSEVDLLPGSDSGVSDSDDTTNANNSGPDKTLRFAVRGTVPGVMVTIYADGAPVGSALADAQETTVTTDGTHSLSDGPHTFAARQSEPGMPESHDSVGLTVTMDTTARSGFVAPMPLGTYATSDWPSDVAVSGTLAYVADWLGLMIIDVSDPARPALLAQLVTSGSARRVFVTETVVYVAESAGLAIIDASDPAHPVRLAEYDPNEHVAPRYGSRDYVEDVEVVGTLAYVACGYAGLHILDVSNPAQPAFLGSYDTGGSASFVAVAGSVAYVADRDDDDDVGLAIIDVSNPVHPVRVGRFGDAVSAGDVVVSGALVYVTEDNAGLEIIDVSNPARPVLVGTYDTWGNAIALAENRGYVADGDVEVLDTTDPAHPVSLGKYGTGASTIALSGTRAFVVGWRSGLQIIDLGESSVPGTPDLQAASDTGMSNTDNVTTDVTPTLSVCLPPDAYFRVYCDGVQISANYERGTTYTTSALAGGTYAFTIAAMDAAGNVSAPSPPLSVTVDTSVPSTLDFPSSSDTGLSHNDRLTNLNNSGPDKTIQFAVGNTAPGATVTVYADGVAVGSAVAAGPTTTVTTDGSHALSDGAHAFAARQTVPGMPEMRDSAPLTVTIDATAPSAFVGSPVLGRYELGYWGGEVAVSGNIVCVINWQTGLDFIDVSDPAQPKMVGSYDIPRAAADVAIVGTRAYVAAGTAGVQIIDITDPASPVRLGACGVDGYAGNIVVSGHLACVADKWHDGRLLVIDVSAPATPVLVGAYEAGPVAFGLAMSGNLVYLADNRNGLLIVDVSNPAQPVRAGQYLVSGGTGGGSSFGVAVSGTLAYLACGQAGFVVLDVSNPAAPVRLGSCENLGWWGRNFPIAANRAYLPWNNLLEVIDVTNPARPVPLGLCDVGGYASPGGVTGGRAYVAESEGWLRIIDLYDSPLPQPPSLQEESDTGLSTTDRVTGDNTPTFDIATSAKPYFRFYADGVQISGDFETGSSYTTPVLVPATYAFTIAIVDVAGNVSAPSQALSVSINSPAPSAPDLLPASDTGASDSDNLTNLDNSQPGQALQFAVGNTLAGATVTLYADGVAIGSAVATGGTTNLTTDGSYPLTDGPHAITARQTVPGVPESPDSAALSVTTDHTSPTVLGVAVSDSLLSSADAGTLLTITATFSESMNSVCPEIRFSPDASSTLGFLAGAFVDSTHYRATYKVADANVETSGVAITISDAQDPAGNLQTPLTPSDAFRVDTLRPAVTINQAATQADPINAGPVHFTVVFSRPVSGFDSADVRLRGTAPGRLTCAVSGSGAVYDVAVQGMKGLGTILAEVRAEAARSASGNASLPSTSTDNSVYFDNLRPTVGLAAPGAGDRMPVQTINSQRYLDVTFADVGTGVAPDTVADAAPEFTLSGAAAANVAISGAGVHVKGNTYRYSFSGSFTTGPVTVRFAPGSISDRAHNANLAVVQTFVLLPSVTIGDASAIESNSRGASLLFPVTLSGAHCRTVVVPYATNNGTARAGRDYWAARGTLVFHPGQTTRTIKVRLIGDTLPEGNENFSVRLLGASQRTAIARAIAVGTILDDDLAAASRRAAGPSAVRAANELAAVLVAAEGASSDKPRASRWLSKPVGPVVDEALLRLLAG
jgi:hypothetical protein